jgi:hypothetical protein
MSPAEALAVLAAGIGAGTINTIVGSGTLITFPVLLAVGLSPVTANVSNTLGLVSGSLAGALGYRRELAGQRERLLRLGTVCLAGGVTGAVLLVTLPSGAFNAIVPGSPAPSRPAVTATAPPPPPTAAPPSSWACSSPASTAAISAPPKEFSTSP